MKNYYYRFFFYNFLIILKFDSKFAKSFVYKPIIFKISQIIYYLDANNIFITIISFYKIRLKNLNDLSYKLTNNIVPDFILHNDIRYIIIFI